MNPERPPATNRNPDSPPQARTGQQAEDQPASPLHGGPARTGPQAKSKPASPAARRHGTLVL
jgi:hypothetical protein